MEGEEERGIGMSLALVAPKEGSAIPGFDPSLKRVSHSELVLGVNRDKVREMQMMNVAKSPGKQLFMTGFMLWMSGSGINIFSIMMTAMALWTPIKALISIQETFERFKSVPTLNAAKIIFIGLNGIALAMGVFKLGSLGLLPLNSSDWISLLQVKQPLEISSGATLFQRS